MINRKEIAIALLMVALLVGVWVAVSGLDHAESGAETQFVYDAVHNAALTCYAVEGAYPEDLDYLKQMEIEDLNIMSEFLVMAATLLDIKAKMLLPAEVNE